MRRLRYIWTTVAAVLVFVAAMFCLFKVDRFLADSARFTFAGPPEEGDPNPGLRIEGAEYTPRAKVVQAFAGDFNRSIYRIPLAERRRNLLALDWVHNASVSRLWPDRVVVRIEERRPLAFVELREAGNMRMALIDEDGVLLDMPARAHFDLPVITGIRAQESENERCYRMHRAMRVMRDLVSITSSISEIDVSDGENLKITAQVDNRALVLTLGNQRFLSRVQNFMSHYSDIRRHLPEATTFDLRLDDRITAVEGAGHAP
jgi:cell division protein FtsQ